mgnify:CR=1 FL=1
MKRLIIFFITLLIPNLFLSIEISALELSGLYDCKVNKAVNIRPMEREYSLGKNYFEGERFAGEIKLTEKEKNFLINIVKIGDKQKTDETFVEGIEYLEKRDPRVKKALEECEIAANRPYGILYNEFKGLEVPPFACNFIPEYELKIGNHYLDYIPIDTSYINLKSYRAKKDRTKIVFKKIEGNPMDSIEIIYNNDAKPYSFRFIQLKQERPQFIYSYHLIEGYCNKDLNY